jgi:hypothetical protein
MKAYLIDPFNQLVSGVETDGSLEHLYSLMDCSYIEPVFPEQVRGDALLLDEDGKAVSNQEFFICQFWPVDALAGKAVWIGRSSSGEFADPVMSRDDLENGIRWLTAL